MVMIYTGIMVVDCCYYSGGSIHLLNDVEGFADASL